MDKSKIQWDTEVKHGRGRGGPTVRVACYKEDSSVSFSRAALRLILGHMDEGHIKLGLDGNHLYIIPCSAEEPGSRYVALHTLSNKKKGRGTFYAPWIGRKLGVHDNIVFGGEVIMKNRDTFQALLTEGVKTKHQKNKHDASLLA